ncbi:5-formyltetrahydrofolate cyclo-ligase [Nocardioides daedukensis]|uniref:5-formyltetrahydrofolate cyclo-ligase n=1 Tax=Nocardioides daedukensis TaxID=634462 RepID=A0A7Y9RYN9_9ACTN|nr:5-formyltetrahydrofolate cyclo-ligase [Nocardioides daedukensis]NYG58675.1 5-formyltetrahydrofolate cyclo-ligase [Nocardioides daedukensis]
MRPSGPMAKRDLRRRLLAARAGLGPTELAQAAAEITQHLLADQQVCRARTVAAYVPVGREPGSARLLDALVARGTQVLLPVLLPDDDLDWAPYSGSLVEASGGLLEPDGARLGPQAIAEADVVLVPGLAVDAHGIRMGRGGGSYDRALAGVPAGVLTIVVLHDGEVLDQVPCEPHDCPVGAVVTPSGLHRF